MKRTMAVLALAALALRADDKTKLTQEEIEKKLPLKLEWRFQDVPLKDVAAAIGKATGIPVRFSAALAKREDGADAAKISFAAEIGTDSLLKFLALGNQFEWRVDDGAVLLETPEEGAARVATERVDVRQILGMDRTPEQLAAMTAEERVNYEVEKKKAGDELAKEVRDPVSEEDVWDEKTCSVRFVAGNLEVVGPRRIRERAQQVLGAIAEAINNK